ncbi:hypothetical protein DUNSADRAFT_2261 [Dunaliella salina]|uniref:Uncharacterized protein n=1 Tax=Dunaliella salina TaxID=3046 RepID=A0ABQ7FWJ2_DUNSA|nr:hypothetical protein DUNSADRAFT_2261 [Dunaliella salina]|eukprot:KAF5826724.1 hypothetical protein DUNSADRAFT_2261 [Dunaliella salina]
MMINCGARGPYFSNTSRSWLTPFRNKLTHDVKLVGPTISCELRPHVQSYAMMTDRIGAALLVKMWSNLAQRSHLDMIEQGEVAFSTALLRSGWNIASLEARRFIHDYRLNSTCDPEFPNLDNSIFSNPTACRIEMSPGCQGLEPCEQIFVKNGGNVLLFGMIAARTIARMEAEEVNAAGACSDGYYPSRPLVRIQDIYPEPYEPHDGIHITVIIRAHKLYFHQLMSFLHSLAANPSKGILALVIAMDASSQPMLQRAISTFSLIYTATPLMAHVLEFPLWLYEEYGQTINLICSPLRVNELRGMGYLEQHIARFCGVNSPLHYVLTDLALLYTVNFIPSNKFVLVSNADNSYSPLFFSALLSEGGRHDIVSTNTILKGNILYVRPEKVRLVTGIQLMQKNESCSQGLTLAK